MKGVLCKQLRHIRTRHKWIKRRLNRDKVLFMQVANCVFDSLFLSAKTVGTHTVKFIISYTIPLLLVFGILHYKDFVKEKKEEKRMCMDKQKKLIEHQCQQIKVLQDSISIFKEKYERERKGKR